MNKILPINRMPYLAIAFIELSMFIIAIWYGIDDNMYQDLVELFSFAGIQAFFLMPALLSKFLTRKEVLPKQIFYFASYSGFLAAVLILVLIFSKTILSTYDSNFSYTVFGDSFFIFILFLGLLHFLIGCWSLVGMMLKLNK